MAKVYYITEASYKTLVDRKKQEAVTYKAICEELNKKRKTLTEGKQLNEGIIDTIKSYVRKGLITTALVGSLLASNQVNAQQLAQAGVPQNTIEMAQQKVDKGGDKVKFDPSKMSNKEIEARLLQVMKKNGLDGSLRDYQKLNPQQKDNILNGIKGQIKSLDDINHVAIGGWEKFDKTNAIKFDTQKTSEERIVATTIDTLSTVPVSKNFARNSVNIQNPEQLKQELNDLVKGYNTIDSIVVTTSSSTLRNKSEAEGMTWKQLSQKRGEEVANLLIGQSIDLGGEGKNVKGEITADIVQINSDGTNGDGTSGPQSPYEVGEYAQNYSNIDPSLWKSAATEAPLPETNLSEYDQYQYVIVKIYGKVVEETKETVDTYNYRYVSLQVKEMGGKIRNGNKREKTDISKCSVKVKKVDHVKIPKGSVLQRGR